MSTFAAEPSPCNSLDGDSSCAPAGESGEQKKPQPSTAEREREGRQPQKQPGAPEQSQEQQRVAEAAIKVCSDAYKSVQRRCHAQHDKIEVPNKESCGGGTAAAALEQASLINEQLGDACKEAITSCAEVCNQQARSCSNCEGSNRLIEIAGSCHRYEERVATYKAQAKHFREKKREADNVAKNCDSGNSDKASKPENKITVPGNPRPHHDPDPAPAVADHDDHRPPSQKSDPLSSINPGSLLNDLDRVKQANNMRPGSVSPDSSSRPGAPPDSSKDPVKDPSKDPTDKSKAPTDQAVLERRSAWRVMQGMAEMQIAASMANAQRQLQAQQQAKSAQGISATGAQGSGAPGSGAGAGALAKPGDPNTARGPASAGKAGFAALAGMKDRNGNALNKPTSGSSNAAVEALTATTAGQLPLASTGAGGAGRAGTGGEWNASTSGAKLDPTKPYDGRAHTDASKLVERPFGTESGGGGGGSSGNAGYANNTRLEEYLPNGSMYRPQRGPAGLEAEKTGIQPRAVDIWGQISIRFRAHCFDGRLKDCRISSTEPK